MVKTQTLRGRCGRFLLVVLWQLWCGWAVAALPPKVAPQYDHLKDLHPRTILARDGSPEAAIVVDDRGELQAEVLEIQRAIKEKTGASLTIIPGNDPSLQVPFGRNLIVLGNRSTSSAISTLYDRFYALTDLKYPGPGGYEVRSVHNPFGDGHNLILLGGSDTAGVKAAAARFLEEVAKTPGGKKEISLGWLLDVKLGDGQSAPSDVAAALTWQVNKGYGSNYFGWNSVSKAMALYCMTGEKRYAREVVRLSFPDARARAEIAKNDGELIENKADPLAGPYHYAATYMVLYWDLIEESPDFSNAEKLAITNGLARQLNHAPTTDANEVYNLQGPAKTISSRHGIYQALTFYTLARYFSKDHREPVWEHLLKASGSYYFAPLADPQPWMAGEGDNLYWYDTCIAPMLDYMLLSGDRRLETSGALAYFLKNQEVLWNGSPGDRNLAFTMPYFLNKAAYVTGDGRWLYYFQRLGLDASQFRVGQSFWPSPEIKPVPPDDLLNHWTLWTLPARQVTALKNGIPPEESFANMSFRTATDGSGDFILLDGWDARWRNPYHTFSILDLRIAGKPLLLGYLNQLRVTVGGTVGTKIALSARRLDQFSLGQTAMASAKVSNLAEGAEWQRLVCLRKGRRAVIADTVRFPRDSENVGIEFLWQNLDFDAGSWNLGVGWVGNACATVTAADPLPAQLGQNDYPSVRNSVTQSWSGDVRKDGELHFFTIVSSPDGNRKPDGRRIAANAAAFAAPDLVIAALGSDRGIVADFSLREEKHFFAAGLKTAPGLSASPPVDIDWNFEKGELAIRATHESAVTITFKAAGKRLLLDGRPIEPQGENLTLAPGTHLLSGMVAPGEAWLPLKTKPNTVAPASASTALPGKPLPALRNLFETELPEAIRDTAWYFGEGTAHYFVAAGKAVYELNDAGEVVRSFAAPAELRTVHWWNEAGLLILGTMDEKVLAYSPDGALKWTFQSEMAPEVYARGKTYWFNTAKAHEGISGLASGVFFGGKSQLFVGSASTLEILDASGALVKRFAQFWGDPAVFQMIPAVDGSADLLVGRIRGESLVPYTINSRTLVARKGGFHEPPADQYRFKQWNGLRRMHFFYKDIDGNGKKEVISDIAGFWNRITVWDEEGRPKSSINFGPGTYPGGDVRQTPSLIRGAAIVDGGGDGPPEIVAALSTGLAVALDEECRLKWSKKLPFTPTALAVAGGAIVIGGESGSLLTLDRNGKFLNEAALSGKIDFLSDAAPRTVLVISGRKIAHYAIPEQPAE